MQGLTTHVLDTLHGKPAQGVRVELWQVLPDGQPLTKISAHTTSAEGRASMAETLPEHWYELRFFIGDYFAALEQATGQTPTAFLGIVPVRFQITDRTRHYHIPLVASPWSYTTYKGGMTPAAH